ncbi:hypothetical protein K4L44_08655 [Halosquirtibacter laminarini]|uniref:Uncharacterized protein n=1 Tax=Halosquirtibacter laminarini TaxID=3374600 RepID=A0AC61NMT3_9BACT|nr:hypothetical protein K4L44_08655 [Prolixibacteraceae bacterium]
MKKEQMIYLDIIEKCHQKKALPALQLYMLLKKRKEVTFNTRKILQLIHQLMISITTLYRRIHTLQKLGFITPINKSPNYYHIHNQKHILIHHQLRFRSTKLVWEHEYNILHFQTIAITAMLFHVAFKERLQIKHLQTKKIRDEIQKHTIDTKETGRIITQGPYQLPSHDYSKSLHISSAQYYRYRKEAERKGLLEVTHQKSVTYLQLHPHTRENKGDLGHFSKTPYQTHLQSHKTAKKSSKRKIATLSNERDHHPQQIHRIPPLRYALPLRTQPQRVKQSLLRIKRGASAQNPIANTKNQQRDIRPPHPTAIQTIHMKLNNTRQPKHCDPFNSF